MSRAISAVVLFGLAATATVLTAQARVPTDAAMKQLVKRVDPVVPAEAAAQKVGGPVIADIIVSPKGTVESVTIVAGPPILHPAATAAFKQWVFKPFMRNGKPVPALVMVEVAFPDPIREEMLRGWKDQAAAKYSCKRDLESAPQAAVQSCAEFVRLADKLPPSDYLERSGAHSDYAESLFKAGRVRESVAEFERALAIRLTRPSPGDADVGALYSVIGILHDQLGDLAKADAAFASAVREIEGAIALLPDFGDRYRPGLKRALERHAAVKRRLGQAAAASALEARAAGTPEATPRLRTAPPITTVGSIVCVGVQAVRLTDDDVLQIRRALPKGAAPWFILGEDDTDGLRKQRAVDVYLEPSTDLPAIRRGRFVFAIAKTGPWEVTPVANAEYVQIPPTSRDARDVWARVKDQPFRVSWAHPDGAPMTDADLIDLVGFLRRTGAATPPPPAGGRPRLATDLQPWPIETIMRAPDGGVRIFLSHPDFLDGGTQVVLVRRKGATWTIIELSGG